MHARTPNVSVRDPRGLVIASVSYFRDKPAEKPEARIFRQFYNTAGRPTVSYDPRLFELLGTEPDARPNLRIIFSLAGAPIRTENVDAGTRLALFGVAGEHLIGWDGLYTQVKTEYDALLRPFRTVEQAQGSPDRNSAFYTYGANSLESASRNQCGRLIRHDDDAGTVLFNDFALTGGVVSQIRHFLRDLNEPDWPVDEAGRDLLNETSSATTRVVYDAMGTAILQADAQNNVQFSDLDVAGQLRRVRLKLAGQTGDTSLLNDIRYDAYGSIERQTAGNGVVSEALYDPQDGRLLSVKAGLPGQPPLQNLAYQYDRVGNILNIKDGTLGTRFFRNQKIEPVQSYIYDSLYQLIEAHGWQRVGSENGPQESVFVSPADPGQLENYHQVYSYDHGGNLTTLVHSAASHCWTQRTAISKYSNRGLAQKADGSLPDEDEIAAGFDANGNRKQLLVGQDLTWNPSNRLRQVDQVVREDAPNDGETYVYDGAGQRKRKIRLAYSAAAKRTHETRYFAGLEVRTSPEKTIHVISVQAGRCTVQVLHWKSGSTQADQYRYNLTNHLGSNTLELDDRADLISEEMYYPYGGTSWWAGPSKVQASYKTRRYSGQERDATGLYYYGQRYYAPWLERWINPDPAGAADGLNLFRFVRNNPVTFLDDDGQITKEAIEAFNHAQANGNAWQQLAPSTHGLDAFQKLSKENIRRLETRLEEDIDLGSADQLFLNPFSDSPFHIVHFSDQDLRQDNVVELFSRKQLINHGVVFKTDNTAEGDLTHLATDDFVFFSLEAQQEPAKRSSRFGDKRYRTPLTTLHQSGQLESSLLQTLDIILPTSRPKSAPHWVGDAFAYGRDFALRDNEDEDTQRRNAMFVGEDMVRGMGLNIMIDVLTYSEVPVDTLVDEPADRLMNSLYRPQVLVPHAVRLRPNQYSFKQTGKAS
ncbi:hypothetical protein HU727_008520 [Pseudomonas sp. SWRI153]|uniref:RHS repeat protein n=2 Tax=Pseudomonas khorasanensis TaxID=2745508 RepID=A0A923F152_9PSED|nr:hypothetical protein [Pseudomonas khorasanensis]